MYVLSHRVQSRYWYSKKVFLEPIFSEQHQQSAKILSKLTSFEFSLVKTHRNENTQRSRILEG